MRTSEHIPGKVMTEFLRVESDNVKISAVVFTMTLKTILVADFRRYVIASLRLYQCLDLGMTGKAFVIRNFISERVTLRTI